jgi:hypothetical protein
MDINLILTIYFTIAVITAIISAFAVLYGNLEDEIDDLWDWLVYSLFWIKQPLKALIKLLTTNW